MQLIRVSSYLGKSSLARSISCNSNTRVRSTIAKDFLSTGNVNPTNRRCFSSDGFRSLETRTTLPLFQSMHRPAALLNCMQTTRLLNTQAAAATKETMEFKAETRKLLDIVTNSIYTDKEVFIRELISNASDALEKYRYQQVKGEVGGAAGSVSSPLEINLFTDDKKNTLTIVDNGIGMSKDELVSNLGTIARSGSKQFVESLRSGGGGAEQSGTQTATEGIIGQFGVGFYSSFMVSDSVEVESLPAASTDSSEHQHQQLVHLWKSDGTGTFEIESRPVEDCSIHSLTDFSTSHHGSKITMQLKESCSEYANPEKIKSIIKKYSNFVSFPVKLNGEVVNTVSAIWTMEKSAVTEEQYKEFYRFIANAYDEPKYRLHFRTDAPIDLKCLFYVPRFHSEKFGMGRTELGVNLYSRKVLIESKPKDLLPEWLRFVKGAVDSEDLPLSLSREKPQDSGLLRRIKSVLTRKLLRFFADEMKGSPDDYREFYLEYHMFLKEGLCSDHQFTDQLSRLLLFESSSQPAGTVVSLDDYISRCTPEQKQIYYLVAPNREAALQSPYYETFKKHDREVLLLYNTIDDFVMTNIGQFGGRSLVSAETSSIDLAAESTKAEEEEEEEEEKKKKNEEGGELSAEKKKLTDDEAADFCAWMTSVLGSKVKSVKVSKRLSDSPALVTDHESGALRRMMKMVEQANAGSSKDQALPAQTIEINPNHPLIVGLYQLKDDPTSVAGLVAEQLLDNCLMAAGLVEDPRYMIPRLNDLLLATTLHHKQQKSLEE